MVAVHEVREVREVPVVRARARRTRLGSHLLMFILGVVCAVVIGLAALSILDIRGTITWPAGRISLGQNMPVAIHHDGQ